MLKNSSCIIILRSIVMIVSIKVRKKKWQLTRKCAAIGFDELIVLLG